eukprot:Pgem_evm1s11353
MKNDRFYTKYPVVIKDDYGTQMVNTRLRKGVPPPRNNNVNDVNPAKLKKTVSHPNLSYSSANNNIEKNTTHNTLLRTSKTTDNLSTYNYPSSNSQNQRNLKSSQAHGFLPTHNNNNNKKYNTLETIQQQNRILENQNHHHQQQHQPTMRQRSKTDTVVQEKNKPSRLPEHIRRIIEESPDPDFYCPNYVANKGRSCSESMIHKQSFHTTEYTEVVKLKTTRVVKKETTSLIDNGAQLHYTEVDFSPRFNHRDLCSENSLLILGGADFVKNKR